MASDDLDAVLAARSKRHGARATLDVAEAQRQLDEARAERRQAQVALETEGDLQTESATDAIARSLQEELDEIDRRLEERAAASPVPGAEWTPPPGAPQPKPRLRVAASVLIEHGGEPRAFPLVDVSRSGALIAMEGIPPLRPGALLFLTLFATEDVSRQIDVAARVVRHTERGTAVDWSSDAQAAPEIARLLDELSG